MAFSKDSSSLTWTRGTETHPLTRYFPREHYILDLTRRSVNAPKASPKPHSVLRWTCTSRKDPAEIPAPRRGSSSLAASSTRAFAPGKSTDRRLYVSRDSPDNGTHGRFRGGGPPPASR